MKLLLDTCTFLWIIEDAPRLSPNVRELVREPGNEVFLSAVSAWEIAVKYALGILGLPKPPARFVREMREKHDIAPLDLSEEAALQVATLPAFHRDPFDRALVCQAIVHGMILVTPDEAIHRYPVRIEW